MHAGPQRAPGRAVFQRGPAGSAAAAVRATRQSGGLSPSAGDGRTAVRPSQTESRGRSVPLAGSVRRSGGDVLAGQLLQHGPAHRVVWRGRLVGQARGSVNGDAGGPYPPPEATSVGPPRVPTGPEPYRPACRRGDPRRPLALE